ncbi:MAG: 16S rRNA (cytosine967-C5)-methyltransferase [Halocynthiibacter sp.]|jgi:16S rRNA (cytosine967-C5)-methyltransferase
MIPAARISAAIDILDDILAGNAAEQVLTRWARANRYAGSGDRAAIRDLVFEAVRRMRSFAWLGGAGEGGPSGRALMIGALRAEGQDPKDLFTGARFAPAPLSDEEAADAPSLAEAPRDIALDCPAWLLTKFDAALGAQAEAVLRLMQSRAPVFLRVNLARSTRDEMVAALALDGVETAPHALSPSALEVLSNPRRIANSQAYADGLVELQDAASQAIVDFLPLQDGQKILDYCAGGGGKLLAMAARAKAQFTAHDIDPRRMSDIAPRAERAAIPGITYAEPGAPKGTFDLVLCDAPCTGSGSWRRAPHAKWDLSEERLQELCDIQAEVLDKACGFVAPGGVLAYATCSLFDQENEAQIAAFLKRHPEWKIVKSQTLTPLDGGDGFFCALLTR